MECTLDVVWADDQLIVVFSTSFLLSLKGKEQSSSSIPPVQPAPFSGVLGIDAAQLACINRGYEVHEPRLISEGLGGTYLLFDEQGLPRAVWKPADEEPCSQNNPKGKQENRSGFQPGTGHLREVAAYLLGSWAGVPATALCTGPKGSTGSMQMFMENAGSSDEFGPAKFPMEQVHKIGLLDLLLLNTDRHGGNILLQQPDQPNLVPIDHGYCLGNVDSLQELLAFEWSQWPQAKQPFDANLKSEILSIDIERNVQCLASLGIAQDSIQLHQAAVLFVKLALARGWTLFQMGEFVIRSDPDVPSQFEIAYRSALNAEAPLEAFQNELEGLVI